ncbi:ABC transporter ATP-binding protein [Aquibium sp. A9E412]|uniref:ABC transporter ATP-binding protein n=1 Tax=Aquibium sp. A9E412 TaxID=2976767 RepID=UPI0025AFD590|nr:ABC transporter ATP-binding protein [Aquibium sp. A9E412]MDN2564617.1 ABC transporter ATP-binding protein [Aquibium sp. A9E412]
MATLETRNLGRRFGPTRAVDDVSLTVGDGELLCLLGPSGSGKSTVLRMLGGFEQPSAGAVLIDGDDVTRLAPERRPTGMVFQSHALWTHMNVFANVAFGLKLRRLPRAEVRRRTEAALDMVGLAGLGARRPTQLSGGQQQRVALARSLVLEPKILLLDEPFASLDQHLRERLREEVREIQRRAGITMVFVTHGQDEALALADRIAVLREGRLEQVDRPEVVYRQPRTEFVAGFIGRMNLIDARVEGGRLLAAGMALPAALAEGPARLALRPEDLGLVAATDESGARVLRVTDFGAHLAIELETVDGRRLKATAEPGAGWTAGMRAALRPRRFAVYRDGHLCPMPAQRAGDLPVSLQTLVAGQPAAGTGRLAPHHHQH